jgi:hypothetical protein
MMSDGSVYRIVNVCSKRHASTGEEALLKLKDKHPIVELILRHRTIAKVSLHHFDNPDLKLRFLKGCAYVCSMWQMKHTYLEALTKHATSEGPMARLRPRSLVGW